MKIKFLICAALVAVSVSMNAGAYEPGKRLIGQWRVTHYGPGFGVMELDGSNSSILLGACVGKNCELGLFLPVSCNSSEAFQYEVSGTNDTGYLLCTDQQVAGGRNFFFDNYEQIRKHVLKGGPITFIVHFPGGRMVPISFYINGFDFTNAVMYMVAGDE